MIFKNGVHGHRVNGFRRKPDLVDEQPEGHRDGNHDDEEAWRMWGSRRQQQQIKVLLEVPMYRRIN